jgi:hypothetical protein
LFGPELGTAPYHIRDRSHFPARFCRRGSVATTCAHGQSPSFADVCGSKGWIITNIPSMKFCRRTEMMSERVKRRWNTHSSGRPTDTQAHQSHIYRCLADRQRGARFIRRTSKTAAAIFKKKKIKDTMTWSAT